MRSRLASGRRLAHLDRVGVALRGAKPARVEVAIGIDIHHLRDVGTMPIALPTDSEDTPTATAARRTISL